MNNNLVVDCSFIMSLILEDERKEINTNIRDYNILVPSIFHLECLNVLNSALKRKRINEVDFKDYLTLLEAFPCYVDKFSSSSESIYSIAKLCSQLNITSYDASYLELALRLDAKMATYDNKLIAACQSINITNIN